MWTEAVLDRFIHESLGDRRLIVVANREPYVRTKRGDRIETQRPAGGIVTALDPIMRACGGVWVAQGPGETPENQRAGETRFRVPPDSSLYTVRRVWLSEADERGYYEGLSNGALWPICHVAFARPVFRPEDWQAYRRVNRQFADAVLEEAGDEPTAVWIQDYHFGLLPRMLRESGADLIIGQFWHIPWPNRESFRAFPWREELLDGMLGNDLLGFHLRYHCLNFLETIEQGIEAQVDWEHSSVQRRSRQTLVHPFPISIDFARHNKSAQRKSTAELSQRLRTTHRLDGMVVGIGIDRLDYTKGIPERLRAIDRFLSANEGYRGKLVFIQVGVPSRTQVEQYRLLNKEINSLISEINGRWGTETWQPIVMLRRHHSQRELMALHQLADFCMVTSLHDGMNLVAKEYVASRFDEGGALILSRYTGAARELNGALIVNPFSVEEVADAIGQALSLTDAKRRARMRRMRSVVEENNIYRWAGKFLDQLLDLESHAAGMPR